MAAFELLVAGVRELGGDGAAVPRWGDAVVGACADEHGHGEGGKAVVDVEVAAGFQLEAGAKLAAGLLGADGGALAALVEEGFELLRVGLLPLGA